MKLKYPIAAVIGALFITALQAQDYPTRPITMVVGYAVGGATDALARILAEPMRSTLKQPILVENITGASGSIGTGKVARATPDGYTLILGDWTTHVANGAVYNLPYDILKDFTPVALLPSTPLLVLSRNGIPAKNLEELIVWLKTNSATQGSAGAGSVEGVAGSWFQHLTGIHMQVIPYRGAAPAMVDMISGRIDFMISQASLALPFIRDSKFKAYAVTDKVRWSGDLSIPTVDEAGMGGFYISVWRGIWAPRATPAEIIKKLNSAVVSALVDPAMRQRFDLMGEEIPPAEKLTPEALGALQKVEIETWWPIMKAAGIKPE